MNRVDPSYLLFGTLITRKKQSFHLITEQIFASIRIVLQEHEDQGYDMKPCLGSEWPSAVLLVVLYMIQGVPLGLSMGSMCVHELASDT